MTVKPSHFVFGFLYAVAVIVTANYVYDSIRRRSDFRLLPFNGVNIA